MNTLRDTDEGTATPSVWPVYLAAAIIVGVGALLFCPVVELILYYTLFDSFVHCGETIPGAVYGLFGFVTAWGVARLRPWAWWCAVAWTITFAMVSLLYVVDEPLWAALIWLAAIALLVWPLATRRRLFFPPKPEREE